MESRVDGVSACDLAAGPYPLCGHDSGGPSDSPGVPGIGGECAQLRGPNGPALMCVVFPTIRAQPMCACVVLGRQCDEPSPRKQRA